MIDFISYEAIASVMNDQGIDEGCTIMIKLFMSMIQWKFKWMHKISGESLHSVYMEIYERADFEGTDNTIYKKLHIQRHASLVV